jgi:hypothetical protein
MLNEPLPKSYSDKERAKLAAGSKKRIHISSRLTKRRFKLSFISISGIPNVVMGLMALGCVFLVAIAGLLCMFLCKSNHNRIVDPT